MSLLMLACFVQSADCQARCFALRCVATPINSKTVFCSFPHGQLQILLMAGFDAKPESEMPSLIGMLFVKPTLLLFRNVSKFLTKTIHQPLRPKPSPCSVQLTLSMRRMESIQSSSCVTSRPSVQVRNHHIGHRTWRGCNHCICATNECFKVSRQ
jgi:hypothetical protein